MLTGLSFWVRATAVAAASCLVAPMNAHHGGDVEWSDEGGGTLTGTATKFAFQFPHVFFEMNVGEPPNVVAWSITTRWTPTVLREHGWSRESIKPGDAVTVTYRPHVERPHVGQMMTIEVNGTALPLSF
jgi:hypothetical protein